MRSGLKWRCYDAIRRVGQGRFSGCFRWPFTEPPGKVLVDLLDQRFAAFNEGSCAIEDFSGVNGMLANPTDWCFHGEGDFYCEVVSNDWQSAVLKLDDQVFVRVRKEMISDYRSRV